MKKMTLLSKMIAAIFVLSLVLVNMPMEYVQAATDYPAQAVKFTTGTGKNLNIKGTSDNSVLNIKSATGTQNENWEINCDGLEGFAGNCLVSEGEKAGTIGGLLGKTVFC